MSQQSGDASRWDFVAAAVGVTAAAGAASGAEAQTPSNLRFSNPPGMAKPAAYSHVVEVNGPHRTVYLEPARPGSMPMARSPRASVLRRCR